MLGSTVDRNSWSKGGKQKRRPGGSAMVVTQARRCNYVAPVHRRAGPRRDHRASYSFGNIVLTLCNKSKSSEALLLSQKSRSCLGRYRS